MEKRYEPIILQRKAEGAGAFDSILDRCPWLELLLAIDSLAPRFFGWPRLLERNGDQVDEFKHAEVIFPAGNDHIVVVVARTGYGDDVIRGALELIRISRFNVRLSLV
jgi:hypothetical protein